MRICDTCLSGPGFPHSGIYFSFCRCIDTKTKHNMGRKKFIFSYSSKSQTITEGSQSGNSSRNRSRNNGRRLLTAACPLAQGHLAQTAQTHLPWAGTTHSSIFHNDHQSRQALTDVPTGQSGTNPSKAPCTIQTNLA